ncbi:hypothetical protein [Inquilinus sp. CAU 1745]|uniref:hypothetical protein n=1 Tax=Inquilinus sp. CAU 1745 TaxID=3140369 RepID=UPI00325B5569
MSINAIGSHFDDDPPAAPLAGRAVGRVLPLGLGLFLAVAICLLGYVFFARGPWVDEFYSLYATDPARSLREAFAEVFLFDNHPPLYNLAFWAMRRIGDFSLETARLFNLGALAVFLAYWWSRWRAWPSHRTTLAIFLVLFLSSSQVIDEIADFRTYFILLMVGGAMALSLRGMLDLPAGRLSRVDVAIFLVTVFLAANLHYFGTLYSFFLVGFSLLALLSARRYALMLVVGGGSLLAAAPAALFLLLQLDVIADRSGGAFWINDGPLKTAETLVLSQVTQSGANVVAGLCAILALILIARRAGSIGRMVSEIGVSTLVLAAAVVAFLLTLFLVSLHTPVVMPRYLVPASAATCLVIATLAGPMASRRPVILIAIVVNALAYLAFGVAKAQPDLPRWDASASLAQEAARECPTRPVYGVLRPGTREELARFGGMVDTNGVFRLAYAEMASRRGFQVTMLHPASGAPPLDPECGAAFWFEHVDLLLDNPVQDWFARFKLDLPASWNLDLRRGISGGVVVASP